MIRTLTIYLWITLNPGGQSIRTEELIQQAEKAQADGAFVEAEEHYREALKGASSSRTEWLNQVLVQIGLASLLSLRGSKGEPEELLEAALTTLRTHSTEDHFYLPVVLNNLGAAHIQTGSYRKAESALNEAKRLLDRDGSLSHIRIDLLSNLGLLYEMTGREKAARAVLEQAAAVSETDNNDPIYLARTLTNMANVYQLQKKWTQAEAALVRAQSLVENSVGTQHPELAAIMINLGYIYEGQKNFNSAETVIRKALDIRVRAFGAENLSVATTQMHLADVMTEEGKFQEAENLYSQSLSARERLSGPRSPEVALTLEHLAKALRLSTAQQARALEDRAKAIRQEQGLLRSIR